MDTATKKQGAEVLILLQGDLQKAFATIPQFGTIGLIVHFHDGEPVRVEWSGSVSRQVRVKGARS